MDKRASLAVVMIVFLLGFDLRVETGSKAAVAVPGQFMAAFLLAQLDQEEHARRHNVLMTPAEFAKRHHMITVASVGGREVKVVYYPESETVMGGGTSYLIDIREWRIVDRREEY